MVARRLLGQILKDQGVLHEGQQRPGRQPVPLREPGAVPDHDAADVDAEGLQVAGQCAAAAGEAAVTALLSGHDPQQAIAVHILAALQQYP